MTYRQINLWCEVVGILIEIREEGELAFLQLDWLKVVLPIKYTEKLRGLKGMRIGILRTDIQGKEFLIRVIDEQPSETPEKGGKLEAL